MRKIFITLAMTAGLGGCASGGSETISAKNEVDGEAKTSVRTVCRKERSSGSSTGSRVNVERVCKQVVETAGE